MSAGNLDDKTEILVAIARLEGKFDNLTTNIPPKIEDHEKRLRALEKARWPLPSVAIVVSILGVILNYIQLHH